MILLPLLSLWMRCDVLPRFHQLSHRRLLPAQADPSRADAVATLGEVTGDHALRRMAQRMAASEEGRLLLKVRCSV